MQRIEFLPQDKTGTSSAFNLPADSVALETLARLFPGRKIRGIEAVDLVWGLGAFHCITQQQPRGR